MRVSMEWTGGTDKWVISHRHRIFALLGTCLDSKMRVSMEWTGGTDKWVLSHRHRIFALALLQCLFIFNFCGMIGAASYRVDMGAELQRSMARYRQLLEVGNSKDGLTQVDENIVKEKVEGEVNSMHVDQHKQGRSEKDVGQALKKVDEFGSPTIENLEENLHFNKQEQHKQGRSEKDVGQALKKDDEFGSPTKENSEENLHFNKQEQQGELELESEQESKKANELESPFRENPIENPEIPQQQERILEKDPGFEDKSELQSQEEVRKGLKEGNTKKEEPFIFPKPYLLGLTIKDWDEQRGKWLEENPHMKSIVNKPRVLIVTGSQPEPCISPVGDYYQSKSFKLKLDYARMHNYEIYYNFAWLNPLFGGWWVKLPTLRTLMLTHPEIEWFFWVDSDAVFTDMLFEAPFHTYEGYNMVMWGWEYGLYTNRSWVAFNAGVFLIRNCQWSLDLIDKWSPMGPKGPVRDEYGKIFTEFLSNRKSNFSSDDQSALAYLMITDEAVRSKIKLVDSTTYTMSGFWIEVVETYENSLEKYHPGLGDKRWPWITHFTGCGYCAGGDNPDYAYERCMETFDRAYNFADNQVLAYMGFQHKNLSSEVVVRTINETDRPLELIGVNPWEERIAQVAAEGMSSG